MNKKNLITQMNHSVNCLTVKDLPLELVELSKKDLQEIVGGATTKVELPYQVSLQYFGSHISTSISSESSLGLSVELE